jgi:CDP-diacylglycerol---glycerol-3-phosphate 3-phosphatidyltransferase
MGVFEHWPNRITALRFVGALLLFGIFAMQGNQPEEHIRTDRVMLQSAFWLFIVTAASDVLDGWLARRGNLVSAFGRIADPFVDKVLVIGAMVFLAVMPWSQKWFSAWIVVVIISREFLITGLRGYVESRGAQFPADWFGKVKMFTQCLAVGIVLGLFAFEWSKPAFEFWSSAGHVFVWATLLTSLGSCLSYLVKTRRIVLEASS